MDETSTPQEPRTPAPETAAPEATGPEATRAPAPDTTAPTDPQPLSGRIALVTGATRGAGRAIARELAAAGAEVHCTGRSTPAAPSDYDRPETVEETAELIRAAGGTAHPAVVDHRDIAQVTALVERIEEMHGRLDILVNDIGGEAYVEFDTPLWEYEFDRGMRLFETGYLTHLITSRCALGLLIRNSGGLVVEVTDGTREYNAEHFRSTVFLDLTKTAVDRLAFAEGHELRPHGCTAVSVTPGWLRSEMMLDHFGVTEDTWAAAAAANRGRTDVVPPYEFGISETPALLARGIAALAADPERARWNTRSTSSFELAGHYGLTDVDGSRPDTWRFMAAFETQPVESIEIGDFR
ncbi:SDR family oxidoreductase [Nocardia zapadnayensis]|uniref:SDR family oxidoreductase n=1 Tax=Brevibacterium sp. R8603A2 TaxID=2929779 RepID=UPI001FF794D3|nr:MULTISPECIES: SDR family oxidoreductase [Actinomycetes]MCK1804060.1 SDR family oxidoreductase [Brevibacterium sp. R8603A2]MCX0277453.1 SDR family oxidoreductase [Nocardia zapadnayensis]